MLILSMLAFTACFAVWTLFSIIGVKIKQEFNLSDSEFGLLLATPVLTGGLSRSVFGILSDRFGGRRVFALLMVCASAAVYAVSLVPNYSIMLLAALGLGFVGGSYVIGVTYVSSWFSPARQGTALGVFGSGTVGTALTSFCAPMLVEAFGWRSTVHIYAAGLCIVGITYFLLTREDPMTVARKQGTAATRSLADQLAPLARTQVWRFSLYYFFMFGGYVALSSWLPRYYMGVYGLSLTTAGLFTTCFALPAAIFRVIGGLMSDRFGARAMMYLTFSVAVVVCLVLSFPNAAIVIQGIDRPIALSLGISLPIFVGLTGVLGFAMAAGMAAIYKHIPVYYPQHVGAVGGMVGMIGALGGFVLPIVFGLLNDTVRVWTSCYVLLFLIVIIALSWMHRSIRRMEQQRSGASTICPKEEAGKLLSAG